MILFNMSQQNKCEGLDQLMKRELETLRNDKIGIKTEGKNWHGKRLSAEKTNQNGKYTDIGYRIVNGQFIHDIREVEY